MLRSLQSRLLASYFFVILVLIILMAGGIVAATIISDAWAIETMEELETLEAPVLNAIARVNRGRGGNLEQLRDELDEIADETDVRLMLVQERNYEVIYDSEDTWDGWNMPAHVKPNKSRDMNENVFIEIGSDGTRWVLYTPEVGERGNVYLVMGRPEPERFSFIPALFSKQVLFGIGLASALAAMFAGIISRSVARPLKQIAISAESVAEGNYEQKAPVKGPREVRELAVSFNDMAQQVQVTQQSQRDFVATFPTISKRRLRRFRAGARRWSMVWWRGIWWQNRPKLSTRSQPHVAHGAKSARPCPHRVGSV